MPGNKEALEEFGKLLMNRVRDKAIWHCDSLVKGHLKGEKAEKLRQAVGQHSEQEQEKIHKLIPEFVDSVLHYFLLLIEDTPDLKLAYRREQVSEFTDVGLESDGLAGELYGPSGWIAKYSQARKTT